MNIKKYFNNIEKMTDDTEQRIKDKVDSIYHIDTNNGFDILRNLVEDLKNYGTINRDVTILGSFSSHLPKGIIACYQGTVAPYGWAICDGNTVNGYTTPNLKGRFIVGYNSNDSSYNSIGKTGGASEVTLTYNQMGSHNHTTQAGGHTHSYLKPNTRNNDSWENDNSNGVSQVNKEGGTQKNHHLWGNFYNDPTGDHSHTHTSIGGDAAHNNLPLYYILMYIIKII